MIVNREAEALGLRVDDGVAGIEGEIGTNPPYRNADLVKELGLFTTVSESAHDACVDGPDLVLFFLGPRERTWVVDGDVRDKSENIENGTLEVGDGYENVGV